MAIVCSCHVQIGYMVQLKVVPFLAIIGQVRMWTFSLAQTMHGVFILAGVLVKSKALKEVLDFLSVQYAPRHRTN